MSLQSRLASFISAVGVDIKVLRGVSTAASTATLAPDSSYHQWQLTAQAVNLSIANPSGSPANGQALLIRIKDNGTARTISWGTQFRIIGVVLPTTTVANKTLYVGCKWNSADTKWDVLAVGQEA